MKGFGGRELTGRPLGTRSKGRGGGKPGVAVTRIALSVQSIAEDQATGVTFSTISTVNKPGDWGTSTYTIVADAGNKFDNVGTGLQIDNAVNYETATSHQLTIRDTPSGPYSALDGVFTIQISNVNEAPTVANVIPDQTATDGTPFSFQFASNTFADVDAGTTLIYTATKSDNSALPAWLTFTAGTRTFSGTPAGTDVGTLSVKVTASDGALTVPDTFDIVVSAAGGGEVLPHFTIIFN